MTYFENLSQQLRLPRATTDAGGLRDAQIAAAHAIAAHFWSKIRPAIVVMPTGSGKTAVMILASILLRARRVLIVVPSRLLREQIANKFSALDPLLEAGSLDHAVDRPRVIQNKKRIAAAEQWSAMADGDVIVTTPHAASPGIEEVPMPEPDLFDLVIFDEAHHTPAATYKALQDAFPRAKTLCFTATPSRRDERELRGDIVFTYDVGRARRDGIFGPLRFVPVLEGGILKERDVAIARAAAAQLHQDREAGHAHRLVVRASGRKRADELAAIYAAETSLHVEKVHSGLSRKKVDAAIKALRAGKLDGVIAVDMLGEGFDLPNLKVAALHSPHRSLAVTLQFIGRFARTASDDPLGEATFFAAPSEINGPAEKLYVPGAEWNELVETLSRDRIETETATRELIRTFREPERADPEGDADPISLDDLDDDAAWALLRTVRPYFHVKVYETLDAVDLDCQLGVPDGLEPLLVRRSAEHNALVWVGRRVSPVLWSRHPDSISIVDEELLSRGFERISRLPLYSSFPSKTYAPHQWSWDGVPTYAQHRRELLAHCRPRGRHGPREAVPRHAEGRGRSAPRSRARRGIAQHPALLFLASSTTRSGATSSPSTLESRSRSSASRRPPKCRGRWRRRRSR